MFTISPWMRRALVVALVGLICFSPGAGAKDGKDGEEDTEGPGMSRPVDQTTVGWILVPTHEATRVFSPMSARGITHFFVLATPTAQYSLESTDSSNVRSCSFGICAETGDFDIVFFHERGDGRTEVTGRSNEVGDEVGIVPPNTSFALVYMKTPGMFPKVKGFEFAYTETLG